MFKIKNETVCFTGHRAIPEEIKKRIETELKKTLVLLIEKGYKYFGAGGAIGFDTIAALTVLKLKVIYPHICLILVLPCKNQTMGWNYTDRQIYETIKASADKVVYTSTEYTSGCMHKRNKHLVDNSGLCVCYLTENKGGTFYTVEYAKNNNCKVINIADNLD